MKIKRFNEDNSNQHDVDSKKTENIWVFIVNDEGAFIKEEECVAFKSKFDAVDHYINWVNEYYDEYFEPMTENGDRLFTSVEENPDWERCLEYVAKYEISIDLISIDLKN